MRTFSPRYSKKNMRQVKATNKERQKQHAYTFRADKKTLDILRAASERTKLSASEILRRSIREYADKV